MSIGLGNSTGPNLLNKVWPLSGGTPYSSGIYMGYDYAGAAYAYQNGWLLQSFGKFTTYSGNASSGWAKPCDDNGLLCCWGQGTIVTPSGQNVLFPSVYAESSTLTILVQFQGGNNWQQPAYTLPRCIVSQPGVGGASTTGFTAYFPIADPNHTYVSSGLTYAGNAGGGLPFQWVAFGYA